MNETHYASGHNIPGYFPDSLYVHATFDEAKASLISDLRFFEEYADTEDEAESFAAAAQDVNLWITPQTVTVEGRAFFISETDEELDDDLIQG